MNYLISQIILCLLIAFLFGLLIGWLLKAASCRRKLRELEERYEKKLKANMPVAAAAVTTKKTKPKAKPKAKPKQKNVVDDLKEISGVGPKLEKLLNKNGIKNFRQIAEFKAADIKALSSKLGAFQKRITDDKWVAQAKKLHFKKYNEKV